MYTSAKMNARANSAQNRYERIRTVGKGAFGSAVLYRRREDSSLVIIKEINMYELDGAQRRLALNEVSLLSRIDHPNIIGYYDSFEEDGVLMIEMEYADGGTLAQLLQRTTTQLDEEQIVDMMIQMLSAVGYLHDNSVLHRDLKTANVFLTKDSFIKIGDFGISKIMGTETLAQGAKTVVGTPYYISPEMCSGHSYNEKSDMWALGCILYEMCCLRKTFEGENLPALVNNIMTGTYAPVKGSYSHEIKKVIRELLQQDPQKRPSANDALKMLRPSESHRRHTSHGSFKSSESYSTLYELQTSSILLSSISRLPARICIKNISVSETHTLILTGDNEVFGWGDNSHGQLGIDGHRKIEFPKLIESLRGRDIQSIGTGNSFTVICCDRGTLLTMGHHKYLGLGPSVEHKPQSKPILMENLLRETVKEIICGAEHTIAILENGECIGWGSNKCGQLGLPELELYYEPTRIPMVKRIVYGKAGKDATLLLTDDGSLMAMGSNRYNKLNLSQRVGFFATKDKKNVSNAEIIARPTIIQGFPERVVDASVGDYHTGVVLESGQVVLFGRNDYGELGHGNRLKMAIRCVKPVKSLLHHACTQIICGNGFTLATTTNQELFFWGKKDNENNVSIFFDEDKEALRGGDPDHGRLRRSTSESFFCDVVLLPSLILRLLDERSNKDIHLSGIAAAGRKVFVAVDSLEGKRLPSALSERARSGSVPTLNEETRTWLKEEFEKAEIIPIEPTKRRVRFDSELNNSTSSSDLKLMNEIEVLKQKIKEQDTTFEGHRMQMSELQQKLQDLQAKQAFLRKSEPPPAYDHNKKASYNKLFADQSTTSAACCIL